jgi:hypothetical protein
MTMASNRTQLTVEIITDATKAAQGLNDVAGKFSDFADKTRKAMAGAFAGAAIIGGIKEVISAASDLQQSVGGTDKVFGAFAQQIHTWAADTSDSIRLPQQAFEELATQMGVQLKSAGLPMAEVTTKVHDLMQASADLAAGMGKDLPDVANAVRSAFAGEYDALQNMGVAISDAVVQAEALKIAQATGAEATDAAVQAQAKYNVIMGGAATFTNQAAEETDTWAGRMDSLKEKLGNAAAAIGGPLLDSFGGLIDAVSESITVFQPFVETAARMVAAVAGLPPPLLAP